MRDLLNGEGRPENDLSKRMGDNVVEALVAYMQAPGTATGEAVHAYSIALNSLALLAIAEQLQELNAMLAPESAPAEPEWCPECHGDGVVPDNTISRNDWEPCPLCSGRGFAPGEMAKAQAN